MFVLWLGSRPLPRHSAVEGAWTYRMQPRVSRKLHDRLEGLPSKIPDIACKGQVRMCGRYRKLMAAGKAKPKVIARDMVGFIWDIARKVQPTVPA